MRTTKEQKIKNYILQAEPKYADLFYFIVNIQDVYYNDQRAMVVEYATFINDEKNITTCRTMLIKDADLFKHHKENSPKKPENNVSTRKVKPNKNYTEISELGFKIEIRSQRYGQSRAYLTNNRDERITVNGTPIFENFYDNKGQSVNLVYSRRYSHLDTALRELLEESKKQKLKM